MKGRLNKNNKFNYITIFIIIGLVLIIVYFLMKNNVFKDKYTRIEEELVLLSKEYVANNNINTTREIYFDINKLNYKLDNECSITSGVIYDGENYLPNLICNEYKSDVIKTNKEMKEYITLNGDEVVILPKGIDYYDPGYISNDSVMVAGNVGTEEGVYNIYYKTKNSNHLVLRKVIIIDNSNIKNLYPTISLNGDEVIYLVDGSIYNELGVIGNDSVDGNISNKVKIDGNVNTNQVGEYKLTYVLTNSRGYSNTITRKVNIISGESDLVVDYTLSPANLTNGDVTIKLSISDDYNKIIYPDGSETSDLTYTVSESGTYKISIYDMYDRLIEKEIVVDNIDKTIPQGTCNATLTFDGTEIKVNITTAREISSYEYFIDGVSSNKTQTNTYISKVIKPSNIKVIITDSINNKNEIICTKDDKITRKMTTDENGKNCLEGTVCYVQGHYASSYYRYCSINDNPNACGGIGKNGCSITSTSNAIAAMGVRSKNGELYNPWTVWEELYPINKSTGQCDGGCSAWTRMREAIENAGLSSSKPDHITKDTLSKMIKHLKKGYPIIVWAKPGGFTDGKHYMALIGVREDNYVFLTDSAARSGTKKFYYKGKQYYADTWIDPNDLITGEVKEYVLVGPKGMFLPVSQNK